MISNKLIFDKVVFKFSEKSEEKKLTNRLKTDCFYKQLPYNLPLLESLNACPRKSFLHFIWDQEVKFFNHVTQ